MQKFSFNLLIKTRLRNKQNNLNFEDKNWSKNKKLKKKYVATSWQNNVWAREMAQQVKVPTIEPADLT